MRNKIFFAILITAVSILIASSFFVIRILYGNFEHALYENLKTDLDLIEREITFDNNFLPKLEVLKFSNLRVTLISSDGTILYENSFDSDKMQNHIARPEIQDAIKKGEGMAYRISDTLKEKYYYVARKLSNGSVLRISTKQKTILQLFLHSTKSIIIFLVMVLCAVFLLSLFLARNIVRPINTLDIENIDLQNNETMLKYPEIKPLLKKIVEQKIQLEKDKANLKRAETIRKDFTANVSHELKTPLQTISGYAELLKSGIAKKKDVVPFAEKIFAESFRMHNLVEDIINLTELETEEKKLVWQNTDLLAVCENVIDSLTPIAEKRAVTITLIRENENGELHSVFSVPEIVHTIVYNLVDNAIKYNRDGGHIFVTVGMIPVAVEAKPLPQLKMHAYITVRDTGIGIEHDKLPRIFERFYRVDKSRSKTVGGTGLGLSIVKHSVALLKADVSVVSQFGEGTEFTVRF